MKKTVTLSIENHFGEQFTTMRYFHVSFFTTTRSGTFAFSSISLSIRNGFINRAELVEHIKRKISADTVTIISIFELGKHDYEDFIK